MRRLSFVLGILMASGIVGSAILASDAYARHGEQIEDPVECDWAPDELPFPQC